MLYAFSFTFCMKYFILEYMIFLQFTAITWIKEFVQLSGSQMLPYMSGIFTAILPCLSYDSDARRSILI